MASDGTILFLANETASRSDIQYIGAANAYALDADGWLTVPYGDSDHSGNDGLKKATAGEQAPQPVIQRLTRADAVTLVNEFRSTWSRIKRAVVGLPIFKGHPDAPRYAKKYPDRVPRGTIADMQVGETGLRLKPVLTGQGADDVEAGWNEVSPFWALRVIGEENGARVAAPFKLFSLGLVPEGNIQGLSLTNAADPAGNEIETMNPLLIKLLAALGITLAANATEEDANEAVTRALPKITAANAAETELPTVHAKVTTLEGQVATLTTAKTEADGKVVALTNERTALGGRATSAEAALKAERSARALLLVNAAVVDGRVPAASRDAEVLALANAADFDAAATTLAARAKTLKTKSSLTGISAAAIESQDRQQQVLSLVNEAMESPKVKNLPSADRYNAAFNLVRKNPAHAALFPAQA